MLRIRDVKKGDEGEYKVEACNEGGTAEASITVSIGEDGQEEEEQPASSSEEEVDSTDACSHVSAEEHIVLPHEEGEEGKPVVSLAPESVTEAQTGGTLRLVCDVSGWPETCSFLKIVTELRDRIA